MAVQVNRISSAAKVKKVAAKKKIKVAKLTAEQIQQKIALKAYELYEFRSGENGSATEDWFKAQKFVYAELGLAGNL